MKLGCRRMTVCGQLLTLTLATPLTAQSTVERARAQTITIDSNVAVPMRDGVVLRADVWRPASSGKHPVLVYRTPYNKRSAYGSHSTARMAVDRGYVVVLEDVRGRYASDGEFVAYQQEGRDGFDTIEWAATQPWSDGNVGTFGLSYPGAVQWLAAMEQPPHLKAMAPAMTFSSPAQFFYFNGAWDNSWAAWVYSNIAPDRRKKLGLPAAPRWKSEKDRIVNTLPLLAVKDFELTAPWYYEWLKHPPHDPWWSWAELGGKYDRVNVPVLNFSAWYDEAYGPRGATSNFNGLVKAHRGSWSGTHLVIGPWTHGVPQANDTIVGERWLGRNAVLNYDSLVLGFMDFYLSGTSHRLPIPPVMAYVLGSNRWVVDSVWPLKNTSYDTLALIRSGKQTTITADPAHPVLNSFDSYGAHDYRALAKRNDVVVFDFPPLKQDLTVIGAMRAEVSFSVDAPDVDIWVKVHDVAPDGTAYNLMSPGSDVMRASYRNGPAKRELLTPNKIYTVSLGDLFTGNTFKAGHTIRVVIAPSFFPDFSRNPQTGEMESTSSQMRVARLTIYHSAEHPSRLILPVIPKPRMFSNDQ